MTLEFVLQDAHDKHIDVFALAELRLALPAFVDKASFFIGADGARIGLEHAQEDAMQVEGIEPVLTKQAHRFCAITVVPIALITNVDAKLGAMNTVVDAE
jgi:hypothetical protein